MIRQAGLELAHVDAECIVAVKPSGLLSVPGRGESGRQCLFACVQAQFADALVVHRLDMATSGLMVFARGLAVQRALSRAFERREVQKRYVAVVHGRVASSQGEIDLPLAPDWPNRPRQRVDTRHGRACLTRFRVLGHDELADTTRLELEPVTGRAHQLRVHLLALGHAILGDALYAAHDVKARSDRLLLHSASLRFLHPASGKTLQLDSKAPF